VNHHFLCVYYAYDQKTGRLLSSSERILTREDLVGEQTIELHKKQLAALQKHDGSVFVIVHSLTNID
jgi:hypothetical protein